MTENGYLHQVRNVWLTFATVMLMIVVLTIVEQFITWAFTVGSEEVDIITLMVTLVGLFFGGAAGIRYAQTHKIKEADDGNGQGRN